MHHTLTLAISLLASAALLAQRPDTGPEKGMSRLAFEAMLLGGGPAVESLEINGAVYDVDRLRRRIVAAGTALPDAPRALLEELVMGILREELVQRGGWLDDGAFEAAYDKYAEPYDSTPFTVEMIATRFKGYPCLEDFKRRWRVQCSFVDSLAASALAGDALEAEAKASRDLLVFTGLEVELWFHVVPDTDDGRADFASATQLAQQTFAALSSNADSPEKLPAGVAHRHLGKDAPLMFNQVRNQLDEGEFTSLLRLGVTEALFAAEPGKLLGPLRGIHGVYVARVVSRHETGGRIDRGDSQNEKLLRELLIQRKFERWIDRVFAKTIIRMPR